MEYLALIVLWCSQPSYQRLPTPYVTDCRKRLIKCYRTKLKWTELEFIDQCLDKEVLPPS